MAGVYVDLKDGVVVGGSGSVSREAAEYTVAVANSVIHLGLRAMQNIPVEEPPDDGSDVPF